MGMASLLLKCIYLSEHRFRGTFSLKGTFAVITLVPRGIDSPASQRASRDLRPSVPCGRLNHSSVPLHPKDIDFLCYEGIYKLDSSHVNRKVA